MAWDYRMLRGKIREVCETQDIFADKLGIGRVSLSQRLKRVRYSVCLKRRFLHIFLIKKFRKLKPKEDT